MASKLFVDDTRERPQGFEYARDYEGAVMLCQVFEFEFMDLDYSLGAGGTGLDLLHWLHDHGKAPARINLHSSNERGRAQMAAYLAVNFPNTEVTLHSL